MHYRCFLMDSSSETQFASLIWKLGESDSSLNCVRLGQILGLHDVLWVDLTRPRWWVKSRSLNSWKLIDKPTKGNNIVLVLYVRKVISLFLTSIVITEAFSRLSEMGGFVSLASFINLIWSNFSQQLHNLLCISSLLHSRFLFISFFPCSLYS